MKCTKTVGDISITYEADSPSEIISLIKAIEDHENSKKSLQCEKVNETRHYNDLPTLKPNHK
jgi:hypothetical protein